MSGQDKPTLPGFRDVFGDPDNRRRQSPAPFYAQQHAPPARGTAQPGGRGYPGGVDPAYLARQHQWATQAQPAPGRSPQQYYATGAAPIPTAAPSYAQGPGPAGGHFSILRTGHGQTQLSTASSSSTYSGLSGTVRPLRHTEYSQYAIATQTGGGVDVRYQCPHCEKGFDRPSSLKTHINSHTGEKPYTCLYPRCGRQFGVLSNMYRHMRTAHEQFITAQGSAHPQAEGDDEDEDEE